MYVMDIVDICWYLIAGLYNMCVQVYEFIATYKYRFVVLCCVRGYVT